MHVMAKERARPRSVTLDSVAMGKAQDYHTSVRTLDELGQAAGRLLALNEYLEQHPQRSSADRHLHGDPQIRISKIQQMQWMEQAGKKPNLVVEFWLDVLVSEPQLLDGVSIPWMLRIDELNEWVAMQPFEIVALCETACSWKEERKCHKSRTPMMSLMLHLCSVADMINWELNGPYSYISCVPRYSVVLGKMREYRGFCEGGSGISKAEQAVLEALERATSTGVGKLSAVYRESLRGLPLPPLPPSPPLPPAGERRGRGAVRRRVGRVGQQPDAGAGALPGPGRGRGDRRPAAHGARGVLPGAHSKDQRHRRGAHGARAQRGAHLGLAVHGARRQQHQQLGSACARPVRSLDATERRVHHLIGVTCGEPQGGKRLQGARLWHTSWFLCHCECESRVRHQGVYAGNLVPWYLQAYKQL